MAVYFNDDAKLRRVPSALPRFGGGFSSLRQVRMRDEYTHGCIRGDEEEKEEAHWEMGPWSQRTRTRQARYFPPITTCLLLLGTPILNQKRSRQDDKNHCKGLRLPHPIPRALYGGDRSPRPSEHESHRSRTVRRRHRHRSRSSEWLSPHHLPLPLACTEPRPCPAAPGAQPARAH